MNWLVHSEFVSVVLNQANLVSCQMKLQSDTEMWGTAGPDGYSKKTTIRQCPNLHYLVHQCW